MFDRSAFKIKTFQQASNNKEYWLQKSPMERLIAAWMLTCAAYNLDPKKELKMDRTYFRMRKHEV